MVLCLREHLRNHCLKPWHAASFWRPFSGPEWWIFGDFPLALPILVIRSAGKLHMPSIGMPLQESVENGPNTVSGSTVSNTELSEFFGAHWVPGSELSEFLSAYNLCAKTNSPSFFAELTEFAPELSEAQWVLFSETVLSKQYSARFLIWRVGGVRVRTQRKTVNLQAARICAGLSCRLLGESLSGPFFNSVCEGFQEKSPAIPSKI